MTLTSIASSICPDLIYGIRRRDDREFLVTRFSYPDGDSMVLYLDQYQDKPALCDRGTTLFKWFVDGLDLTESRDRTISHVCAAHGIQRDQRKFWKVLGDRPGVDVLQLCEGLASISTAQFEEPEIRDVSEQARLNRIVAGHSSRSGSSLYRHWTHPVYDPTKNYPVDYRLTRDDDARNVFYVGSPMKCLYVAAACGFMRHHNFYSNTLAIIDKNAKGLNRRHVGRLQDAATDIIWGLDRDVVLRRYASVA